MSKPLCIDLYCGLGGWTEGFLAEGYEVVGFDIEAHVYGDQRYPAQLVLQDVLTIHGRQFKDAAIIVASSPCQAYSYMAMPWTRAKQIANGLRGEGEFPEGYTGYRTIEELNALFEAPKRIQREAIEAAGRFIPMIQENVRGAIPWVGRSAWNFGSYHLWGDVPALMPMTLRGDRKNTTGSWDPSRQNFTTEKGWVAPPDGTKTVGHANRRDGHSHTRHLTNQAESDGTKNPGFRFDGSGKSFQSESVERGQKNTGGSWFNIGSPGQKVTNQNPVHGKVNRPDHTQVIDPERGTKAYAARLGDSQISRKHGSKSSARKAASARIAKIPFPLANHIARVYHP